MAKPPIYFVNATPKERATHTLELLKRARALILNVGWTQGVFARLRNGNSVNFDNERATCFCTFGAMKRAANELRLGDDFVDEATSVMAGKWTGALVDWNDAMGREKLDIELAFDFAVMQADDELKAVA